MKHKDKSYDSKKNKDSKSNSRSDTENENFSDERRGTTLESQDADRHHHVPHDRSEKPKR